MLKLTRDLLMACCFLVVSVMARNEPFILGADISWIPEREAGGVRYADNGTVKDIMEILKEHRFNWIRLRLFVDPTAEISGESESPYSSQGFCNLEHTRIMAKRVKEAGMKFLLDFHYSDTWADPEKQYKPVSWKGFSFAQLTERVRSYTRETLQIFRSDGCLPDMVQVGNEVVGGMIWPDGKSSNMSSFAALVNAGIDGVKGVDSNITIMIHSIPENSPSNWLKSLINAGVNRIDVFGLSYYSKYHGTPDDLQEKVNEIAENHRVKIVLAEYADNHSRVNDIIYDLPNEQGVGTFVWEPADWLDVLFDWRNGRRETNSKIDLYPQMSDEYGNDDFVSIDKKSDKNSHFQKISGLVNDRCIWNSPDGLLNYRGIDTDEAVISMVAFDGRLVKQWKVHSSELYNFVINDESGNSPVQSGRYLLMIDSEKSQRKVHTTGLYR